MCGNVWEEHTLNEVDACKAILNLQFYQAHSRSATLRGEASVFQSQANICCPVCSKTSGEHSEADLDACVGKWRKRERGATGLELLCDFVESDFKTEIPIP